MNIDSPGSGEKGKQNMIGYYNCGLTGYEIHSIEYGINDKIKWLYIGTQREQRTHTTRIYYTAAGRAYFRPNAYRRIYLDECMRSN